MEKSKFSIRGNFLPAPGGLYLEKNEASAVEGSTRFDSNEPCRCLHPGSAEPGSAGPGSAGWDIALLLGHISEELAAFCYLPSDLYSLSDSTHLKAWDKEGAFFDRISSKSLWDPDYAAVRRAPSITDSIPAPSNPECSPGLQHPHWRPGIPGSTRLQSRDPAASRDRELHRLKREAGK